MRVWLVGAARVGGLVDAARVGGLVDAARVGGLVGAARGERGESSVTQSTINTCCSAFARLSQIFPAISIQFMCFAWLVHACRAFYIYLISGRLGESSTTRDT